MLESCDIFVLLFSKFLDQLYKSLTLEMLLVLTGWP